MNNEPKDSSQAPERDTPRFDDVTDDLGGGTHLRVTTPKPRRQPLPDATLSPQPAGPKNQDPCDM